MHAVALARSMRSIPRSRARRSSAAPRRRHSAAQRCFAATHPSRQRQLRGRSRGARGAHVTATRRSATMFLPRPPGSLRAHRLRPPPRPDERLPQHTRGALAPAGHRHHDLLGDVGARAVEHGAVNLGQGFPDYPIDAALIDLVTAAMRAGHNQYPLMAGVLALREAIAGKVRRLYGRALRPRARGHRDHRRDAGDLHRDRGAGAPRRRGDRVRARLRQLRARGPTRRRDAGAAAADRSPATGSTGTALRAAITPRTRLIVVNTPNNPGTSVLAAGRSRRSSRR